MQGSDLKRVSGLWLKDGKKGKFMSGQTDADIPAGTKLLIFKNDKKSNDKQPDYHLYCVGEDGAGAGDGRGESHQSNGKPRAEHRQTSAAPAAQPPPTEDSIPF